MIGLGMVVLWGSYGLATWGYDLIRGWDIPARQWFSPLHPYQWPKSGDPPPIPAGQVFPSNSAAPAARPAAGPGRRRGR